MRMGGAILGLSWLCACGGGASATLSPPEFSYNGAQPFPAVVGEPIALTPAMRGSIDRYVVSPELPSGLVLNRQTGVISGTPTKASEAATFVITAANRGSHSTYSLVLSVTDPPSHLSYPSPAEGIVGAPLAPLSPRISGTIDHYAVLPPLPAGVVLDSSSGLITGTPQVVSPLAPYTITASSQAGSTGFIFLLAVAPPAAGNNH